MSITLCSMSNFHCFAPCLIYLHYYVLYNSFPFNLHHWASQFLLGFCFSYNYFFPSSFLPWPSLLYSPQWKFLGIPLCSGEKLEAHVQNIWRNLAIFFQVKKREYCNGIFLFKLFNFWRNFAAEKRLKLGSKLDQFAQKKLQKNLLLEIFQVQAPELPSNR